MISNIGLTAVIAAAGLGLNAIKSDYSDKSRLLIFISASTAIAMVFILGFCYFTGVVSFTSYGDELIYRGQQFNGKADGNGTIYDGDEIVYTGQLKNNQYYGKGALYKKQQYSDGTEKYELAYIGNFANNQYDGKGISFAFGDDHNYICYVGEFKNGVYSGEGKWYNYYEEYKGDEVDLTSVTTDILINTSHLFLRYEGSFAGQMYNGWGKEYEYENGRKYMIYEGPYKDNKRNGDEGTLYFSNGQVRYHGSFKDETYHGYGTEYILRDGYFETESILWYQGYFVDGRYEGKGTLYDSYGSIEREGEFRNGSLISGVVRNSNGEMEEYIIPVK